MPEASQMIIGVCVGALAGVIVSVLIVCAIVRRIVTKTDAEAERDRAKLYRALAPFVAEQDRRHLRDNDRG